jgi:hypothetical protein
MNISSTTRRITTLFATGALVLASAACGDQSASPTATPPADQLSSPAAETAVATPASPPSFEATPLVEVTGLFTDPRPTRVDEQRSLGPKPAPVPWDFESRIVVDTKTGTTFNLGTVSGGGAFSPGSTSFAWTTAASGKYDDGVVSLIALPSGERKMLGQGRLPENPFYDNNHVTIEDPVRVDGRYTVDVRTGDRRDIVGGPPMTPDEALKETTPYGYVIHHGYGPSDRPPRPTTLANDTGTLLLRIDALDVKPAGHGMLAVATRPDVAAAGPPTRGTSNIFLVDVASGRATFIATAAFVAEVPLVANDDYVLWTDSACDRGTSKLYDRRTGRITEIDTALWPSRLTPAGLLLDGVFGGHEVIDINTFSYVAALPPDGVPAWSPDLRYAAIVAVYGGRDGPCAYF